MKSLKKIMLVVFACGLLAGGTTSVQAFSAEGIIEETVLIDENDIKITATELTYNEHYVSVHVTIENNSDEDITAACNENGGNSVNGYMTDEGSAWIDVASGETVTETIDFYIEYLQPLYGISEIESIELSFSIKKGENEYVDYPPVKITTQLAESFDYETNTYRERVNSGYLESYYDVTLAYYEEEEIYNQNGVIISSEALFRSYDGEEEELVLEIENTTDQQITFRIYKIYVNGLLINKSGLWSYDTINAGARHLLSIYDLLEDANADIFDLSDYGTLTFDIVYEDMDSNPLTEHQLASITLSDNTSFNTEGEELYNSDGVVIISKGLFEDPDYDEDSDYVFHWMLLFKNDSGHAITVEDEHKTFSVNGIAVDNDSDYEEDIADGMYGIVDIGLELEDLEEAGISEMEIDEITNVEISVNIVDENYEDYNIIDTATLSLSF
ncbi:MAG: hypothetical protein LIO76_11360 [Clostridiales bacterium]|nr:hypothetical protein [Clostridiales bacterium]